MAQKRRVSLPGGMQVKVNARDGVVYSSMILHLPSNYSTKLRRVIHLSYHPFGGQVYPYSPYFYWNLRFTRQLSQAARAQFEPFGQVSAAEHDHVESFFRTILAKDGAAFRAELAVLHPGEAQCIVCVVLLSRLAGQGKVRY